MSHFNPQYDFYKQHLWIYDSQMHISNMYFSTLTFRAEFYSEMSQNTFVDLGFFFTKVPFISQK